MHKLKKEQSTCSVVNHPQDLPYDSPSSVHFQIGIGAPKLQIFDQQFCVGLLQTICKQWPKGLGEILTLAQGAVARVGFQKGFYYLLFGPHPLITVKPAFKLPSAVQSLVLYNCNKRMWPKKQVIL